MNWTEFLNDFSGFIFNSACLIFLGFTFSYLFKTQKLILDLSGRYNNRTDDTHLILNNIVTKLEKLEGISYKLTAIESFVRSHSEDRDIHSSFLRHIEENTEDLLAENEELVSVLQAIKYYMEKNEDEEKEEEQPNWLEKLQEVAEALREPHSGYIASALRESTSPRRQRRKRKGRKQIEHKEEDVENN